MQFPIIKVRNKSSQGCKHIVGTNSHDLLMLDENGNIKYHNMQCCEGTGEDGAYEFVGEKDEMYGTTIEFVTLDELVEIYIGQTDSLCESDRKIIGLAKEFREKQIEKIRLDNNNGIINSAGHLI